MVRAVSLQASDFQRALGSRPVSRTAHFVLHALPWPAPAVDKLSTGPGRQAPSLVDDLSASASDDTAPLPVQWRLGLVLPKKQARRSVTRSLIRHQAREALRRHAPAVLGATPASAQAVNGWVVRLKTPFDRQQYPSAASDALKLAVRQELDELWGKLAQGGWRLPEVTRPAPVARDGTALASAPTPGAP